ncbi:MAG TPA: BTAD domain-containing putative transcriptional regulator, partial [Solirubrobacteraceae bacterium]|nr:BTAD domain-containing putative transcriptional regulator [Solirubrobacteraceae bacterium]
MDFRLLGPVEARADGRAMALRGTRQRALLAVLLLRCGAPVSRDRLLEDLWGERVPDGAVKALQVAASRLRRALLQDGKRLVGTPGGYRLLVEPGELDLDRFETLAAEGRRALTDGHAERAALRLRASLAEWRGPPLADLAFEPFAQAEVVRLEALRAAAVSDRIEADLMTGRHAELVPELEALVLDQPLEERPRAQLIRALHRAGRRGEALAAYRDAVRVLEAELGLHPGPELERAQRAVLDDEPAAAPQRIAVATTQRRATATVLATELAGLTQIRAERGDEQANALRRVHDPMVRDVLVEHGGREVNVVGDGILAAFESAAAAVTCATGIQRAVDRQSQGATGMPSVRIGIAAGDVTWEGDELSGMPVAEAVRLCAAAEPGRILVGDAVRLLAGPASEVPLEDAGELSLPDLAHPVSVWEVRWDVRRSVVPPLAPALIVDDAPAFAGRAVELAALKAAWQQASDGRRRGVLITGEPGIGKTRLAAELAGHAASHGGVVLYGRCDDGPAAPAQPFAEALSAYAAACPRAELRAQLGEHAGDLQVIVPSLRARLPDVAEAPPAAPEIERLRTLEATAALLETASRPAPILLVVDDLHWADELTLLLLQHLMRADIPARLLVVATYRDSEPSRTALLADVVTGLARRPGVARLELAPLTEPDVAALLEDAGRGTTLAPRVRAMTEGNP